MHINIPRRESVPLPAYVDDWVQSLLGDELSFEDLSIEALENLRNLEVAHSSSRTSPDADLATWVDAEARASDTSIHDRITVALCVLCEQRTGVRLLERNDEWRYSIPTSSRPTSKNGKSLVSREEYQRRLASGLAAWQAAGQPHDPAKKWYRALRDLKIPDDELFDVYVLPDCIGESLHSEEASALLRRVKHLDEYSKRLPDNFIVWPVNAGPMSPNWHEREAARLKWLRSIGLTVPSPDEATPERRAWEEWKNQKGKRRRRKED
jgi:hypothetical protein